MLLKFTNHILTHKKIRSNIHQRNMMEGPKEFRLEHWGLELITLNFKY